MMQNLENMFWSDIRDVKRFTENTQENKHKKAKKTSSIVLASIQLTENFIKGIKSMNAYEAASTILSEANWIQKSSFTDFIDDENKKVNIKIGTVYYVDYGKTFAGELAYFHYGLCIAKKDNKYLIIPITSGTDYFSTCYHPRLNPTANKKNRQALKSEGFAKDCVLKINDAKYISAGRIEKEVISIDSIVLSEIQVQFFAVSFPRLHQNYINTIRKLEKQNKQILDQKELIHELKSEKNHLKQLLNNKKKLS